MQSGERRNAKNLSETVPPSALESSDLSVVAQRWSEAGFAAWVSDQELVSIRRRTRAGLEKTKTDGKKLGAPRRLFEEQEAAVIEVVASGVSQRRVARSFGVSPATVRRSVKRE